VAHSLLCLLGSTQARESIDVPRWGSYNPCKGRVLEWRLRMYGMYHHSSWVFTFSPFSLTKNLSNQHWPWKKVQDTSATKSKSNQTNYQTKWHWQVHYESFSFLSKRWTSLSLSIVA
jgi:hypothetical protein